MKKLAAPVIIIIALMAYYYYLFRFSTVTYIEPRALIIPVISVVYAVAVHGFKDSIQAFKTLYAGSAGAEALRNAGNFLKTSGESVVTFTGICTVEGVMDMFLKLHEKAEIGPRLAFALIGMLYGLLLYTVILAAYEGIRRQGSGLPE
jgi:hypothetical protein